MAGELLDRPAPAGLRCEYKENPLGLDVAQPRLSWRLVSDERGALQTAYQIVVAESPEHLEAMSALLWDSGKVSSSESIHRPYGGPALHSGQRCFWKVRIWDERGRRSAWSEPAWWEMGLLSPSDWLASWIEAARDEDADAPAPCPMLRTEFTLDGPICSARLYITSLGLYEAVLNGRRVGDELFTPGWTSYQHRLQYQTYDVGALLTEGQNALGVTLGDGWYRGNLGFTGNRRLYGDRLALLAQLRIDYADGRTQVVLSDETWKAATGPIRSSDFYNGERYDARLFQPEWARAGYDDRGWDSVRLANHRRDHLVASAGPPVRRIQEIRPAALLHTPAGETVFDMGQNMVGWVRLKVEGPAGATVTLRHAEVLDADGNFYTANLRSARQEVAYTLRGGGPEVYEPHFTFQGFRYVAVEGFPGQPDLDSIAGVVIHSDMTPIGRFECSDPRLNQLQHNIVWGQKGNFVDVPTDCPQRDERLGWTGDAQVFARTACFNMDAAAFFTRWLRDMALEQRPDGGVPWVIPDVIALMEPHDPDERSSAGWSDAIVIIPWTVYLCYGDMRLLAELFDAMKRWVEYVEGRAGERLIWEGDFHFGDWVAVQSHNTLAPYPVTSTDLIATAFFARSADLVGRMASILGRGEEAERFARLAGRIREAFCAEYVTPNGRIDAGTQTDYVLPLMFDLLPESMRPEAARRLVAEIRRHDNHLSTGFLGTPYLCHVLSRYGCTDVAYDLLMQDTWPSWLYPLSRGATTIWERWDGIKPDGQFQDAGMNSFNHYAYGAIGEWLYRVVAGIEADPAAPGYRHILIQPQPGGGLTHASASLDSPYGTIESAWESDEGGAFRLKVRVPPNTTATVRLPAPPEQVTEGGAALAEAAGILGVVQEDDVSLVKIGAGTYTFTVRPT